MDKKEVNIAANRILEITFRKYDVEIMHSNLCKILEQFKKDIYKRYRFQNFKGEGTHLIPIVEKLKDKLSVEEIAEVLDITEVRVEAILK